MAFKYFLPENKNEPIPRHPPLYNRCTKKDNKMIQQETRRNGHG